MIPTQFMFEYEVIRVDQSVTIVWTPLFNKSSLMTEGVKEVKLKQQR
jgi:hypothetical protein